MRSPDACGPTGNDLRVIQPASGDGGTAAPSSAKDKSSGSKVVRHRQVTVGLFIREFLVKLGEKIFRHFCTARHQRTATTSLLSSVPSSHIAFLTDFGENYAHRPRQQVQPEYVLFASGDYYFGRSVLQGVNQGCERQRLRNNHQGASCMQGEVVFSVSRWRPRRPYGCTRCDYYD